MYGQCFPSPVSLGLAPSPCTRLSRAPSSLWASPTSITASASLRRFPIGRPTRPAGGRDSDGSPRFLTLPFPDVPCSQTPPQSPAVIAFSDCLLLPCLL